MTSGWPPDECSGTEFHGTDFAVGATTFVFAGGYISGSYSCDANAYTTTDALVNTAPYLSSGVYHVVATTAGGSSPQAAGNAFTSTGSQGAAVAPDISGGSNISPTSGAVGTIITLAGVDFTQDMVVVFDYAGTAQEVALTTFTDQTSVSFARPAHANGVVACKVKNNDGTSSHASANFTCT